MRYDKEIYFITTTDPVRLPNGDYTEGEEVKDLRFAHISDMGDETRRFLSIDIKEQAVIMRIQNNYDKPFEYIEYDGLRWKVLRTKKYRRDASFECGEL